MGAVLLGNVIKSESLSKWIFPKKMETISRTIRRVGPFVGRVGNNTDPTPSKNFLESTANESRLGAFDKS